MKKTGLVVSLLLLLVAGCAPHVEKTGRKIHEKDVKRIVLGVTERDDIVRIFGDPTRVKTLGDGSQEWTYEYRERRSPSYFGGLIVDEKRAKESYHLLKVVIDEEGKVVSYHFKKKEEE